MDAYERAALIEKLQTENDAMAIEIAERRQRRLLTEDHVDTTLITRRAPVIVRKTNIDEGRDLEYVLSTSSTDRYGDQIDVAGWQLDKFNRNPVCLFSHDANFPVGRWQGVSVRGGALRGHLELAPAGASPRIDEVRALVGAGVLRATSVGFIPLESSPLPNGGMRYTRQELVEVSLVSTPANADCLQVARSLKISDETMALCFKAAETDAEIASLIAGTVDERINAALAAFADESDAMVAELIGTLAKERDREISELRTSVARATEASDKTARSLSKLQRSMTTLAKQIEARSDGGNVAPLLRRTQ